MIEWSLLGVACAIFIWWIGYVIGWKEGANYEHRRTSDTGEKPQ